MSILCSLKNINLAFGTKVLFKNASFAVNHNDRIGLLGLNGQGKSSLFKILTGECVPDISEPPFLFDKAKEANNPGYGYSVFMVPQEFSIKKEESVSIRDCLFRFFPEIEGNQRELSKINKELETVQDEERMNKLLERQNKILQKLEILGAWEISNSFESYLKYFGLQDLDQNVSSLSGGEQKKILLSLGLSSKSNLILWDEPTNHLDIETIKKFETELSNVQNAFILISHDRYLLSKVTNSIFHIKDGEIKSFSGSYQDYLEYLVTEERTREAVLQRLKNSLKRETEWMRQGIKARGCRSKKRVENYEDLREKVSEIKSKAKRNLDLEISQSQRKTKKLIELKDVCLSFGDNTLFKDLSLTIKKGDKIGLLGKNGIGKSSLVNLIAGNLAPTSGEIKRADDIKIQVFNQKREELDPSKTPFQILGDGDDYVHLPEGRRVHVNSWFESFLFNKEFIHRPLSTFSGGERNRMQMALNFTKAGDLWIFDEPTNDLDLETLQILENKLAEFKGSLILISHDRTFLSNSTNKIWSLDNQTIENFEGGYEQVEAYMDALSLEKDLLEEAPSVEVKTPTPTQEYKKKLSNKDKERIKTLEQEIPSLEDKLEKLEDLLSGYDYSNVDKDTANQLKVIADQKDSIEEKILTYYEELEELKQYL